MKRQATLSMKTGVLLTLIVCAFSVQSFAQDKAQKIDELVSLYHKYRQFNGSALVAENGKVVFKKGFGLANMEWNIPNEPDTKFRLGSITKQFTATLILQLVEQGKIKLDAKITDYLQDYRRDTGSRVTIHQLLSHTSGIPNYTDSPDFFKNVSRNPFSVDEFVKQYASGNLEFEPGTKFAYSNSGYFLLGAIVEKVTGKSYEEILKENVFEPLGMKNTGYDHHGTIISKRASGYVKTVHGYENAPYLDMTIPYASGSLYSTAEDLLLWDQALYGDKILSARSKELMFKPNLNNYGYGFFIKTLPVGPAMTPVPVVGHTGGINGFNTIILRLVGTNRLIVLLDNTEQGRYLEKIALGITNVLYDQPYESASLPIERKEIKVDPKIYDRYIGQYELAPTFVITVTSENGKLMAQATGQPKFELFPAAEKEFFLKAVDAQVSFVTDDKGQVMQLVLHQGGRDIPGKKIR